MASSEAFFKTSFSTVIVAVIVAFAAYAVGYSQGKGHAGVGSTANTASAAGPKVSVAGSLGNAQAKLTIQEYADYQCPYCSVFNKDTLPQLKQDFIDTGKVRFEFINAPLLGEESVYSAAAAYCARDQDKYWQYHEELYKITSQLNGDEAHPVLNKGIFSTANLKQYAVTAGLDPASFNQCVDSGKYVAAVLAEQSAATKAGVNGTPYFIIGTQSYSGLQPYSIMKSIIEAQL